MFARGPKFQMAPTRPRRADKGNKCEAFLVGTSLLLTDLQLFTKTGMQHNLFGHSHALRLKVQRDYWLRYFFLRGLFSLR